MTPLPALVQPSRVGPGRMVLAVALGIAVLGVALLVGPAGLGMGDVVAALADRLPFLEVESSLTERELTILWEIRLPRAVMGALVGATLASAGAAYQGVFRNPLADPYLLGVAAGAGLGATVAILLRAKGFPSMPLAPLAFVGAVLGVALSYGLSRTRGREKRSATTLVLAGVAVASFLTAVQTFLQLTNVTTLREVYSWILGRLVTVGWGDLYAVLPYMAVSWVVLLVFRRALDVMAVGDDEAATLGLSPRAVRLIVVGAATLGAAAAVSASGLIAFVGIIVPHTVRLLAGWSYRVIIPLSLLLGGAFLTAADLVARTVVSPAELPIGVVTAFLGGPFFLMVLRTSGDLE